MAFKHSGNIVEKRKIKGHHGGGTLTPMEKGQQIPGGGGKKGAKSFKRLLKTLLEQPITNKETGVEMTHKQAASLKMLAIVLNKDSGDADRIRAFLAIRDTIGEKPTEKQEITGKDGGSFFPALAGIEIKQIGIDPDFDAESDA